MAIQLNELGKHEIARLLIQTVMAGACISIIGIILKAMSEVQITPAVGIRHAGVDAFEKIAHRDDFNVSGSR